MAHMISIYHFTFEFEVSSRIDAYNICHLNILLKADFKLKPSAAKSTLKLTKGPTQYLPYIIYGEIFVKLLKFVL